MIKRPHFTLLLSCDNLKTLKEEQQLLYKIIAEKDCYYCSPDEYKIVEIVLTTDDEDEYDLELILNSTGSLIIHEDESNCFCLLEEDIPRLTELFDWGGAGLIIMGEMLTIEEKIYLLKEVADYKNIYIDVGIKNNRDWVEITPKNLQSIQTLFASSGSDIKIGDMVENIWWPHLIEKRNYLYVIQKEEVKEKQSSIWDDEDYKNYYLETEYEYNYNIPAWYRDCD